MVTSYQNPFYDSLFGNLNSAIPSKHVRYKRDNKKRIFDKTGTPSSRNFENYLKQVLSKNKDPNFPFKGKLFLAISIAMLKKATKPKT